MGGRLMEGRKRNPFAFKISGGANVCREFPDTIDYRL